MGRRLGQHFLVRQGVLTRIAGASCDGIEPLVIEIGPGKGALTAHLLDRTQKLVAIELDPALAGRLREQFGSRITVVEADVLEVDLSQWGPAVIAGNLPYYITSPIIERTLELGDSLRRAVFLVQREVAARLAARPGSRDYGYLSVRSQTLANVEVLFGVPAAAFRPPPKVDSAVVRLTPRAAPPVGDLPGFLAFAGRCFHHKRKNLRNNLAPDYSLDGMVEAGLRAEQLSIEDLIALWRRLAR